MSNVSKPVTSAVGRIALTTGIACVACCVVPMFGVIVGSTAIAGLAMYSEKVALAVVAIGVFALVVHRITRKAGPSCKVDGGCGCNPASADLGNRDKD